jgi:hypothetical protein
MTGARQRGGQTEEFLSAGCASVTNSLPVTRSRDRTPSQARESDDAADAGELLD